MAGRAAVFRENEVEKPVRIRLEVERGDGVLEKLMAREVEFVDVNSAELGDLTTTLEEAVQILNVFQDVERVNQVCWLGQADRFEQTGMRRGHLRIEAELLVLSQDCP